MPLSPSPSGSRRTKLRAPALTVATSAVLGLALCAPLGVASASATPTTPAPVADSFAAQFAAPGAEFLPSNRYWVASGTGSPAQIRADIEAQAANGIGRITYNDLVLAQGFDPGKAFGSDAWSAKFREALRAGLDNHVQVDALIAPGWSAGSNRVTPDTDGSAKTLGLGQSVPIPAGGTFSGGLPLSELDPAATKRDLQGLLAVRCDGPCDAETVMLDRSSVVDLTGTVEDVGDDGSGSGLTVKWTAPAEPADGNWLLLAYYSQGSGLKPTAGLDAAFRGTVLVDHYGAAGAQSLIDTWDQEVLDDELRGLLAQNAGSMWLDSVELTEASNWTPTLLEDFQARRGYSLVEGLPTISLEESKFEYSDGSGERFRSDWMTTMSENFQSNHLAPLKTWANGLGMTLRYQTYSSSGPAAFYPTDAWQAVDIPESESHDSRAVASAAALNGVNVLPTECCAFIDFGESSWRQKWPDMLYRLNQTLSTGSTLVEFHGFPEQNDGSELSFFIAPNAWPGWTPFSPTTGIAEAWDTRQPSWTDQKSINEYLGRSQFVLRQGTLNSDFAVYSTDVNPMGEGPLGDEPAGAGYSWGYLGDADLAELSVREGVLASDGPAYRSLVLNNQDTLSLASADTLIEYANAGLPVIVIGDAPSRAVSTSGAVAQDAELAEKMSELLALPNVTSTAGTSTLSGALIDAGVPAAASVEGSSKLQILHRTDNGQDYYFLFNAAEEPVTTSVDFTGTGSAYELDPWSGEVAVAPLQQGGDGRVAVPVELAPGETSIVVVAEDPASLGFPDAPTDPFVSANAPLFVEGGTVYAKSTGVDDIVAVTAGGLDTVEPGVAAQPPVRMDSWELSVEAWGKGADGLTTEKTMLETIPVIADGEGHLPDWQQLPGLENVSGVGVYRTTVTLAADWGAEDGAMIELGPNFHTRTLTINGTPVQLNQSTTQVDVREALRPGENSIEIRVTTTLRNAILDQSPSQAGGTGTEKQNYGVTGPVSLAPYVAVELAAPTVTPEPTPEPTGAPGTTPQPTDGAEPTPVPTDSSQPSPGGNGSQGGDASGGDLATTGATITWRLVAAAAFLVIAGLVMRVLRRRTHAAE
ncbi:glycosyl hydrolase [Pseudoclavibacter terrae]